MKLKVLTIALCIFFNSCQDSDELVEFKPLTFDNNGKYVIQREIPKDFYKNLQKVLYEYGVTYIDSNGVVFVKFKDYQNKELIRRLGKKNCKQIITFFSLLF